MQIKQEIMDIALSLIGEISGDLVEATYRKEGGSMVLRFTVDTPTGITVDQCSVLNRKLGEKLDEADLIGEHYILEVASPGLDRPLKDTKDFKKYLGKDIKITTYAPINRENVFVGTLLNGDDESVVIRVSDGRTITVGRKMIASAKLHVTIN